MSIDAKFISYDHDAIYQLANIEAGRVHIWTDSSIGRFVIAYCYNNDYGGDIHLVDDIIIEQTQSSEALALINDKTLEHELPPGLKFEIDIVDFEGESGRLVLQHILPNGILNSLN